MSESYHAPELVTTKKCSLCQMIKPLSDFHKMRNRYQPRCKECRKAVPKTKSAITQVALSFDTRTCKMCHIDKLLTDYYRSKNGRNGCEGICKKCSDARKKQYNINNPEKARRRYRNNKLQQKFGIYTKDYDAILEKQGGVCAICGKFDATVKRPFMPVDHCHETGKVRGILCHTCNTGLGHFHDDIDLMRNAIAYLEKHERGV